MIFLTKQLRESKGSLVLDVFSNKTMVAFKSTHVDEATLSSKKGTKMWSSLMINGPNEGRNLNNSDKNQKRPRWTFDEW